METADLPEPVRRAVEMGMNARQLQDEAWIRLAAVGPYWGVGDWPAVIEFLGLTQGYLTAMMRRDEEREAA